MMAGRTLLDIPGAVFQVILHNLASEDHASLRQVSRSVSTLTTQHAPHVILRLSDSSSAQQLRQWFQATRQLHHVESVHIHVTDRVSAEIFELVMQQLSQRLSVKELHLLAVAGSRKKTAVIPTLQPLRHVLPHMTTLVVQDIAVKDMPADLQHLAAKGGWQLQSLALNAEWGAGPRFGHLFDMGKAFPKLEHLEFRVPKTSVLFGTGSAPVTAFDAAADAAVAAWREAKQHAEDVDDEYDGDGYLVYRDDWDHVHKLKCQSDKLSSVAVAAAVAHVAMQLEDLRFLKVTDIPDIWKQIEGIPQLSDMLDHVVAEAAASTAGTPEKAAVADAANSLNLSTTTKEMAEALVTLDDFGCWLLQRLPALQKLHISTGWPERYMIWQQQQQSQHDSTTSSPSPVQLAELQEFGAKWNAEELRKVMRPSCRFYEYDHDFIGHSVRFSCDAFMQYLSWYSSRPASYVMRHITSCELACKGCEIHWLPDLLRDMKSLKHLKVELELRVTGRTDESINTTVKAAASVQGLKSFVFRTGGCCYQLPADLLLPLTAAAGGPGSRLTKLELAGDFLRAAATAAPELTAAAAVVAPPAVQPASETAPATAQLQMHQTLQQFDGLRELIVSNMSHALLEVAVESLPANLEVLEASRICIVSAAAVSASTAHGAAANDVVAFINCTDKTMMVSTPRLRKLSLDWCELSSPGVLASEQLQQLEISHSNWQGSWAAAAAAWPNLRNLKWKYDEKSDIQSDSSEATPDISARAPAAVVRKYVKQSLQDIVAGYKYLKHLTLMKLPPVSVGLLQPMVRQMKLIQHVHLDFDFLEYWLIVSPPDEDLYTALYIRHAQHLQLSEQSLRELLTKVAAKSPGSHSNCEVDRVHLYCDLKAIERCLMQQLPWASLSMTVYI